MDYWNAWNVLRAVGGYSGRWKGCTRTADRLGALKRFGRRKPKKIIDISTDKKLGLRKHGMTVKTFLDTYATPGVRYWICTSNHIVTALVKDGEWQVIDQDHYEGRENGHTLRQRVDEVWEL